MLVKLNISGETYQNSKTVEFVEISLKQRRHGRQRYSLQNILLVNDLVAETSYKTDF